MSKERSKLQRVMKQTIVLGFTKCFHFRLSYISSVSGNAKKSVRKII